MLLHSAEVRWFYQGEPPDEVMRWYCSGRPPGREPPRTDRYLWLPGCTTVSIKIREGKLEVKAQAGQAEAVELPGGLTGIRNQWVKWSLASLETSVWIQSRGADEANWIAVGKTRLARSHLGPVEENGGSQQRERWSLELVRISLGDQPWWSLAFEVSGDHTKVKDTLSRALKQYFTTYRPPWVFDRRQSYAYPAWLDLVARCGHHDTQTRTEEHNDLFSTSN